MKWNSALKISCLVTSMIFSAQGFAQDNTNVSQPMSQTAPQGTTQTTTQIDTSTMSTVNAKPTTATPTPAQDELIKNTLTSMIKNSPFLSKLPVDVMVSKGVVTLTGTVDSDSQASTLVENANSIIGVSDVDTGNLKVKESKQPFTDMMTTAKIKGLLIREKLFGEKDIAAVNTSVETKNGVVYLTGVVENQAEINNAIDIIKKSVPGVTRVEYSIKKVQPTTTSNN